MLSVRESRRDRYSVAVSFLDLLSVLLNCQFLGTSGEPIRGFVEIDATTVPRLAEPENLQILECYPIFVRERDYLSFVEVSFGILYDV